MIGSYFTQLVDIDFQICDLEEMTKEIAQMTYLLIICMNVGY